MAGATSLMCALAIVVCLALPRSAQARPGESWFQDFLQLQAAWAAIVILALLAVVQVCGSWLAAHLFRRAVRTAANPVEHAQRLLRRTHGPGLAGAIGGTMAFVLTFGMLHVVTGEYGISALLDRHDAGWGPEQTWIAGALTVGTLSAAIFASTVGALVVARAKPHRWGRGLMGGGIGLWTVTAWLGTRFDVGPIHVSLNFGHQPTALLRVALTAMGTTALFVLVTGFALWRHRREQAAIQLPGPP